MKHTVVSLVVQCMPELGACGGSLCLPGRPLLGDLTGKNAQMINGWKIEVIRHVLFGVVQSPDRAGKPQEMWNGALSVQVFPSLSTQPGPVT